MHAWSPSLNFLSFVIQSLSLLLRQSSFPISWEWEAYSLRQVCNHWKMQPCHVVRLCCLQGSGPATCFYGKLGRCIIELMQCICKRCCSILHHVTALSPAKQNCVGNFDLTTQVSRYVIVAGCCATKNWVGVHFQNIQSRSLTELTFIPIPQ